MTTFTTENRDVWNELFSEVAKSKPAVGRTVRVLRGKHAGETGRVTRHILSKFGDAFRYGNEASRAMMQARGRHGFAVKIDGRFWTGADNTMVCCE